MPGVRSRHRAGRTVSFALALVPPAGRPGDYRPGWRRCQVDAGGAALYGSGGRDRRLCSVESLRHGKFRLAPRRRSGAAAGRGAGAECPARSVSGQRLRLLRRQEGRRRLERQRGRGQGRHRRQGPQQHHRPCGHRHRLHPHRRALLVEDIELSYADAETLAGFWGGSVSDAKAKAAALATEYGGAGFRRLVADALAPSEDRPRRQTTR